MPLLSPSRILFSSLILYILFQHSIGKQYKEKVVSRFSNFATNAFEFVTAIGDNHVAAHFPSSTLHAHIHSSILHQEVRSASKKGGSVAACTSYNDVNGLTVLKLLNAAGIPTHVTYSSAANKKLCFVSFLHWDQDLENFITDSIQEKLTMIAQIPTLLKMESSLSHTFDWLRTPHPPSVKDSDSKSFAHPIVQDIANGEKVSLTVIFRDDWSRKGGNKESVTKLWTQQLKFAPSVNLWDDFYWTHNATRSSSTLSACQQSNERHKMWLGWKNALNVSSDMESICNFDFPHSLSFRRNTIEFQINPQHLTYKFAHCLAQLAITVISHESVSRVALSRPMRLLNNNARGIVQSGIISQEPFSLVGLNGNGQIVGIADTGIDENSCFFRDDVNGFIPLSSVDNPKTYPMQRKIVQYLNYSGSGGDWIGGHGSHVAGTIAGDCINGLNSKGESMAQYNGMAPKSKIAFFDIMDDTTQSKLYVPSDLAKSMFRTAYSSGARLYSNSWGGSYWYDAFSIEVDDFSYNNPDFLAIFAAGNDGSKGMYTIVSPAMAKNAIAVAASNTGHTVPTDIDLIPAFSSKGPAPDGRIKPDITAPGAYINSAKANIETHSSNVVDQTCEVEPKSGTSMAAPVCAGNAALVRQYFADKLFWSAGCNTSYPLCNRSSGFSPPGYLIKAVLLNSGTDMRFFDTGEGNRVDLGDTPDFHQGYGRVDLSSVLPLQAYRADLMGFDLFVDHASVTSFTELVYSIHVQESLAPLRITLCWYDPPNQEFAARVLLHDLDLVLVDPEGRSFYGNDANRDGLPMMGVHRDELNSVEQVVITIPLVGHWRARVQAKLLTQVDTQNFAIVITQAGYVEVDYTLKSLEPSIFQDCHSSELPPTAKDSKLLDIQLSLWSMTRSNGWNSSDKYFIMHEGIQSGGSNAAITGTFSEHTRYEVHSQCLYAGCYKFSLALDGSSNPGTLLSIPVCTEMVLSPLSPTQTLCLSALDSTIGYSSIVCRKKIENTPTSSDVTFAAQFSIILVEDAGAGWGGGYYSIRPHNHIDIDTVPKDAYINDAATVSGTMEWGFEMPVQVHLPLTSTCSMMKLTSPLRVDADPLIFFDNAYLIDDNSGNFYQNAMGQKSLCPFYLNSTLLFAKICQTGSGGNGLLNTSSVNMDITFLRTRLNVSQILQLGAQRTLWRDYLNATAEENLVGIGSCRLVSENVTILSPNSIGASNTHRPVSQPTRVPIAKPTTQPTKQVNSLETLNPDMFPVNLTCFENCTGYSSAVSSLSISGVCEFLMNTAYPLCSSYSISNAQCAPPSCASCSAHDWCFIGASAVTSCAYTLESGYSLVDSSLGFKPTIKSQTISTECIQSERLKAANITNTIPTSSVTGLEGTLSGEMMFLIVVGQVAIICCILQWLRRSLDCSDATESLSEQTNPQISTDSTLSPSSTTTFWQRMFLWRFSGAPTAQHTRLADSEHSGHSMTGASPDGDVDSSTTGMHSAESFNPVHNPSSFSILSSTDDDEGDEEVGVEMIE